MAYRYKINPFSSKLDLVSAGGVTAGSWGSISTKIIASGAVALNGPGRYAIDTEGSAASDTLKTITGLVDGDEILLLPASPARSVKIADGIGNLRLQVDFTLNAAHDSMRLVCDASLNCIESGGRSNN